MYEAFYSAQLFFRHVLYIFLMNLYFFVNKFISKLINTIENYKQVLAFCTKKFDEHKICFTFKKELKKKLTNDESIFR